jgi:hypothetical protein
LGGCFRHDAHFTCEAIMSGNAKARVGGVQFSKFLYLGMLLAR